MRAANDNSISHLMMPAYAEMISLALSAGHQLSDARLTALIIALAGLRADGFHITDEWLLEINQSIMLAHEDA